jgi:hypothetical protein
MASEPLPAWMIRLISLNNIEFNMNDRKWYWQRNTVINDGDYIVRIDPKLLELARLANGEDPRVKDPSEAFLKTIMGQIQGKEDDAWLDGFGYGVMAADKLTSIIREDGILAESIDAQLKTMYDELDGAKETRQ